MIRVAVVSPSPALRSGLRALLSAEERIEVLVEAATMSDLDEVGAIDVIIMADEGVSPATLRAMLQRTEQPPAILLLSERPEATRLISGLPLRAWGLLPMEAGEGELIAAVLALHEGLLAAAPALMQPLLGPVTVQEETEDLAEELTQRELDVLQLLAQGLLNKEIAAQLKISEHTVKFHTSAIYAKLGVTNRTEAMRRGARLGLIVL